jgi:steroid delta-isomerase-like uncharacterized protein
MAEEIPHWLTHLLEAWNAHDLERAAALYAADYEGIDIGEARPQHGREAVRRTLERYFAAFPDLHFTAEETIIQGNRLAVTWSAQGTHRGHLMNIPPTGRTVVVRGITVMTIEGNQAKRGIFMWDVAGLLRSIGLLPEL